MIIIHAPVRTMLHVLQMREGRNQTLIRITNAKMSLFASVLFNTSKGAGRGGKGSIAILRTSPTCVDYRHYTATPIPYLVNSISILRSLTDC